MSTSAASYSSDDVEFAPAPPTSQSIAPPQQGASYTADDVEFAPDANGGTIAPTPAASAVPPPQPQPLNANPNSEGVYQMQGPTGTAGIPYSKVQAAKNQGYDFTSDAERQRNIKDTLADPAVRKSMAEGLSDTVEGRLADSVYDTGKQLATGLKQIIVPTDASGRATGGYIAGGDLEGAPTIDVSKPQPGAPLTKEEAEAQKAQALRGLATTLNTGGKIGVAIAAPEMVGLAGMAAAGDAEAIAALAKIATSIGIGTGAGAAAGATAKALKLSPEAQELAKTAAFWAGAGLTGYATKVDGTSGPYGEKGVKASVGPASGEIGYRPAYRQPSPEGGYDQGSTIIPGKVTGRVSVGNHSVGTPPPTSEAYWSATPQEAVAPTPGEPDTLRALPPPIGATEAATGRPVLHQSPRAEVSQAAATAEHPAVKDAIAEAIQPIGGAKIAGARDEKDPERRDEKIDDGQSPRTVRDYSGYRVAVDTPAARDQVVAALKQKFEVHGEQDNFANGDEEHGFHAHTLNVREPGSPVSHEVQVLPREVAETADDQHGLYERARDGDRDDVAKLKDVNAANWQAFQDRQEIQPRAQNETGPANTSKSGGGEVSTSQANMPENTGERRTDGTTRKRIDQMTQEEMRQTLLTSDKTGLPNRRAFDERQQAEPSAAVAMSDADGLKALNDKFGYAAGDGLLRAKAAALKEAGVDAYHDKGDEFLYRGQSPEALKAGLEKARGLLRNRIIEATTEDGQVHRFKGADFSYGTGSSSTEAESGLKQHKADREASGERARGELRGIAQVRPEESNQHQGGLAEFEAASKAPTAAQTLPLAKGSSVVLPDGSAGTVVWTMGGKARVARSDGSRWDGSLKHLTAGARHIDLSPIGNPIPTRVTQIKKMLAQGTDVRIFTARVAHDPEGKARQMVEEWSEKHLGQKVPVTNEKDDSLAHILDDKANVIPNGTGPFDVPAIPTGKWLGVDLDKTIAEDKSEGARSKPQTMPEAPPPTSTTLEAKRQAFVDARVPTIAMALHQRDGAAAPRADTGLSTGVRIKGDDGKPTTILTPSGKHRGLYRLVEAYDLIPSHDYRSFEPNPKYPAKVQERDYKNDSASQHRVIDQAQNYDPAYTVNTNPDAVNGPPIITPDGIVLGGNSRAMSTQRAYAEGEQGAHYRHQLHAQAEAFGFEGKQLQKMDQPILVREIQKPSTQDEMERLGSALNKNMTGALTPSQKAVSAGRKITPETMDELGRLIDSTGDSATIRDMMRERGTEAIELLRRSGALTDREAQGLRDGVDVSEEGKQFMENAILGNIVDDAQLMTAVPKSILNKLDGALAAVTNLSTKDDAYDIIAPIRKALAQHAEIADRKVTIADFQDQGDLMEHREANPIVDAIARKLAEKPIAVKKAFRDFATSAKDARLGQGSMFDGPAVAVDKFNESFGTTLTEGEYKDGIAHGIYEDVARGAEERSSEGNRGIQASGAGKSASSRARVLDRAGAGAAENSDVIGRNTAKSSVDPSSTFYSNPLDPALFKKYIGEPLLQMAVPLREQMESREEVAGVANNVHDALQQLDRTNKATTLEAKGIAHAFETSGFTKPDGDRVFANMEDSTVKLTPNQETLRDKWIKPLDQRAALQRQITLLIKSGEFTLDDILSGNVPQQDVHRIAPEQKNYQHRIALDKNSFVDRILGDSMKRFRAPGGALSHAFSSGKRSIFQEIRGVNGEREAVAVKNGRVTQFRMGGDGKPTTTDLGPYRSGFVDTKELADEAAAPLVKKMAALNKEHAILTETQGRVSAAGRRIANIASELKSLDDQIKAIHRSIAGVSAKMSDEEALAARLQPIQQVIDRLTKQKAGLKATPENTRKIARLVERIQDNQRAIDAIREQHDGPQLEGRYWRAKDGSLWKFDRGTTKFLTGRTGQKYHANAMLSSLVNYMETNKVMNAAIVMERMKGLLEDNGMAFKTDNPTQVTDGWKPTTLTQMRGYYFPAHVADAFDQFEYLQSRGQPNMLERVNRFIIQSVLMNPLMHGKNIAANWFTGKAAEAITGSVFLPSWYQRNMEAGLKAVNAMRDMGGPEYRRLLRLGLDLQGANTSFDRTSKDILRSFTDQLGTDKESNAAMSALMVVPDAAKWLQDKNHLATFGINDLFLLQSYYAAEAKFGAEGVPDPEEAARDWAHQQVAEYTTPVRVAGSPQFARFLENTNVSAFWRYHFGGILRPVLNAVKEAAGSFTPDEEATKASGEERNKYGQDRAGARTNAIGRLAVMTLFATVVYPKLDRLAKKITGDQQAKAPRGGELGFASNIGETLGGDRTLTSTLGSVFTPALGTEELIEAGINRDFFTGRHIMGTESDLKDKVKQLAEWLGSKSMPGQMSHRFDQGRGKQVLYGLLGFTFPMEHGLLEAAKIRSEAAGSNPTDPKTAKIWQSILAAAEQAHRSDGKDTRVKTALLQSGKLTPYQRKELIAAVRETPIVFAASDLERDDDVWRVFEHSTDEEKQQLVHDPRTFRRMFRYAKKLSVSGDKAKADGIAKDLENAR